MNSARLVVVSVQSVLRCTRALVSANGVVTAMLASAKFVETESKRLW